MTRAHKIVGFLLVTLIGAWGCSKAPTAQAEGEKNPSLEAKAKRMEEDFRAAAAARDQFRQQQLAAEEKLTAAENRGAQLQTQLDESRATLATTVTERDTLRADLKTRTTERDNLAGQYETFRKSIKNLLGQAENALNAPPSPAVPATVGTQPAPTTGSALNN